MNQIRIIELPESAYAILARQAALAGISPETWLAHWLESQYSNDGIGQSTVAIGELQDAESIEQFFGSVSMPSAVGADNDLIDADIAREIADTHEES